MDATAPTTLAFDRRPDGRRAGGLAWLAFAPVGLWLLVLVAAPTLVLVAFSFCDVDPDLNQPVARFTLDNYRQIFEPAIRPLLWHATVVAAVGGGVGLVASGRLGGVRWGAVLGGCGAMSWGVRHLGDGIGPYVRVAWTSVELAGLTTVLCVGIGYPVALIVGRLRPPWRDRLLLAVMIPFWTSFLIRTYAWVTILNQNGLLNAGLRGLHLTVLIPASGAWLYTPSAVVLGLVYAYLPFMILPVYASVEKLDATLIEASLDLGAGPVRTLAMVIVPMTAPGVAAGVLLVFVPAIGMYAVSTLLGGGAHPMVGDQINEQFNGGDNQPLGAALAVTLMAAFGLVLAVTAGSGRQEGK